MSAGRTRPDLVVDRASDLTPAWLTTALRSTGADVVVTAVELEAVGTGQMGLSYRLHLTYGDGDGSMPSTLVAKLPTSDLGVRPMVAGAYATEIVFYREVATSVAIRTPACHYAAITEDNTAFVLLLEDLAPAVQGDQLTGSSLRHAEQAVVNLAGLHGPRWCDPSLAALAGLDSVDDEGAALLGTIFVSAVELFLERFGGRLGTGDAALLPEVAAAIGAWVRGRPERFGLVHGDYRLDNLMFLPADATDAAGGANVDAAPVAAVDWQTLGIGLPARDLAYFLGTSLAPDVRREHERHLIGTYHEALIGHGVDPAGYPLDLCFDDYRFAMLQGPLITVLGAAYGTRTDRGDEMFLAMITRSCAAIRDLGTLDLI